MEAIAAEKVTNLDLSYDFTPVLALVTDSLSTYTVTVDSGTDIFTATGHDFVNGTPVTFSNSGGELPGAVSSSMVYFVVNAATNTFKISESIGGAAVNITSNGSGINTVTEVAMSVSMANNYDDAGVVWDVMVRHEVASYQGAARQSFSWGNAERGDILGTAIIPTVTASIIPTTGNITAYYAVLLRGANTTRGDSTGAVSRIGMVSDVISSQGALFSFSPSA